MAQRWSIASTNGGLLPTAAMGSTWPVLLIVRHDKHIEIMMEDRARKGRAVVIAASFAAAAERILSFPPRLPPPLLIFRRG